jgi:hypothetical protein
MMLVESIPIEEILGPVSSTGIIEDDSLIAYNTLPLDEF